MRGGDIAGVIDRDRAADGVGHLQAAAEAGIGQQDRLPVSELDRRNVGLRRDAGEAVEIAFVFLPAPVVGGALHLADGDTARSLGARPAWVGEPGPLRRRIHLGADPDIVLAGVGVDRLHQIPRLVRQSGAYLWFLQGHDLVLLVGRNEPPNAGGVSPVWAGPLLQ